MSKIGERARRLILTGTAIFTTAACARQPDQPLPPSVGIQESLPNTDIRSIAWNSPEYFQQSDVSSLFETNSQSAAARETWINTPGGSLFIGCADGRCNHALSLGSINYEELGSLAGTVTDEMKKQLLESIQSGAVTSVEIVSHTTFPDCVGCGAQGVKADLGSNPAAVHTNAEAHGIGHTVTWVEQNVESANPGTQSFLNAQRAYDLSEGSVPVRAWVFDHVNQRYLPIAEWLPGQGLVTSIDRTLIDGQTWSGQQLSRDQLSQGGQAIMDANNLVAPYAAQLASENRFNQGQSFRRIVITDNPMPSELFVDANLQGQPDQIFNTSLPVTGTPTQLELNTMLDAAMAGVDYALAHASSETQVIGIFRSREIAEIALARFQQSPAAQSFLANPETRSVTFVTYDETGTFVDVLAVKPAHTTVKQLQLASEFPISAAAVPVETTGRAISTSEYSRIESLIAQLQDSNPEVVQLARNELAAMGAVQIEGQWVVMGENWSMSSGPVRFSRLVTRFPNGKPAFIGMNTPYGIIGFENGIHVDGTLFGWKLNIPKININSTPFSGLNWEQLQSSLAKILMVGWTAYEVDRVVDYATQTDHIAVWQNSAQQLDPPAQAHSRVWDYPPKWANITTKWELSPEWLNEGWNGSGLTSLNGAQIPTNKRVPIFLYASLAGTTIPQNHWPSYGPEGNRISSVWEYQRNTNGTHTLWLHRQQITPGTSGEYVDIVLNETGMWLVPYYYEFGTMNHPGLFIQQALYGEQVLFGENMEISTIEMCSVQSECFQNQP